MTETTKDPRLAKVDAIMERRDQSRLDSQGGYPSDWLVTDTHVIVATSNYKGPAGNELEYEPIDVWLADNECWLEDDEDEDEDEGA